MTILQGLTTMVLTADDVDAASRWYADLLGITPYYRQSTNRPLRLHRVPHRSGRGRTGHHGSLLHDTVPGFNNITHHLLAHRRYSHDVHYPRCAWGTYSHSHHLTRRRVHNSIYR